MPTPCIGIHWIEQFLLNLINSQKIIQLLPPDVKSEDQNALKCTKLYFDWGSAPNPAGELTALPQIPYLNVRRLLLNRGKGEKREGRRVPSTFLWTYAHGLNLELRSQTFFLHKRNDGINCILPSDCMSEVFVEIKTIKRSISRQQCTYR